MNYGCSTASFAFVCWCITKAARPFSGCGGGSGLQFALSNDSRPLFDLSIRTCYICAFGSLIASGASLEHRLYLPCVSPQMARLSFSGPEVAAAAH